MSTTRVQEKFSQNFLARECRAAKDSGDDEAAHVAAVRATLQRHYQLLVPAFMYYSCSVSSVPFFMGLNEFTALLDDCQIPDNESQGVKRSDLDTAFIVCTRKVWPLWQPVARLSRAAWSNRGSLSCGEPPAGAAGPGAHDRGRRPIARQ